MSSPTSDVLVIQLTSATSQLQRRLNSALSVHGISLTEYLVLRRLNEAPEGKLRRIDVAESVGLTASGVTRLLNPMVKTGLVDKEKAPRDARVSLVALTEAGRTILRDSGVAFLAAADEVLASLSDEDRRSLHQLTRRLA